MSDDFISLNIDKRILKAIDDMGFIEPTPVQIATIPLLLAGKDIMAQAQTGTGKTAAFGIPIIQTLRPGKRPCALVLVPTRELGLQVSEEIKRLSTYVEVRILAVYGGTSIETQIDYLRRGIDIVVGTPGRIIDHIKRGTLDLKDIRILVLDEADRMMDMGFIEDIDYILSKTPKTRQTMLFSATLPEPIRRLGREHMNNPEIVSVSEEDLVLPSTKQMFFSVGRKNKIWALCRVLDKERPKAIVFAQTKHMVDVIEKRLASYGYPAAALHGDLTQARREKVLNDFRAGKIKILIATDVASRGLDIEGVSYVINYDIPDSPEAYVHRIGRTGRAGKEGKAITFVSSDETHLLEAIQKFTDVKLKQVEVPQVKGKEAIREVLDFDELSDIFGMVRFKMNVGRNENVNSNELSEFVCKVANVDEITIGHIDIQEDSTIIEVHKDVALKILKSLRQASYKGKRLSVDPVAKTRGAA